MGRFAIAVCLCVAAHMLWGSQVSTAGQKDALPESMQARLWVNRSAPYGPALYKLRPLHASWCPSLPASQTFVRLGPCGGEAGRLGLFALIPTTSNEFTLRGMTGQDPETGRLMYCATVARNVVIGPARIESLPCDLPPGAGNWGDAGAHDQRFRLRQVSYHRNYGVYEVVTSTGECWDVRDQSREAGAEIVQFRCNGQGNQRFELRFSGSLPGEESEFLGVRGWTFDSYGVLRNVEPVPNVNLPGHDYLSLPTDNDHGVSCAARCAGDDRCRASSWVRPGVQGPQAMCWLKDAVPDPQINSDTASVILR